MLITACILSYNSSHTLIEALESILNQEFKDFELIVSDDCSTDNSWDIIKSYAKKYKNIIPLRTPQNLGMAKNANFALSNAIGKYLAILHHDDSFRKDMFTKWVTLLEEHPNLGMCFNDYSFRELNVKSYHKDQLKRNYNNIISGQDLLKNDLLKYWGCSVWGSYIFRRSIWIRLNGFNENFSLLADVDFTMRIASVSDIGYIDEQLIDLKRTKPKVYPEEYTTFGWERIFILFYIHSVNINKNNYPNYLQYLFKRFVFRNKLSLEIIKWHLYALYKNKREIIKSYPRNGNQLELFYVKFILRGIRFIFDWFRK